MVFSEDHLSGISARYRVLVERQACRLPECKRRNVALSLGCSPAPAMPRKVSTRRANTLQPAAQNMVRQLSKYIKTTFSLQVFIPVERIPAEASPAATVVARALRMTPGTPATLVRLPCKAPATLVRLPCKAMRGICR
jgi:hypothetical protein